MLSGCGQQFSSAGKRLVPERERVQPVPAKMEHKANEGRVKPQRDTIELKTTRHPDLLND